MNVILRSLEFPVHQLLFLIIRQYDLWEDGENIIRPVSKYEIKLIRPVKNFNCIYLNYTNKKISSRSLILDLAEVS